MLRRRLAAADAVANALRPAEASLEIAAIEASRVVTIMMEARRDAGLRGFVGGEPLALADRASALVLEAQRMLHQAHAALVPVAASIGLAGREHMYGCEDPPAPGPGPSYVRILFGQEDHDRTTAEAEAT